MDGPAQPAQPPSDQQQGDGGPPSLSSVSQSQLRRTTSSDDNNNTSSNVLGGGGSALAGTKRPLSRVGKDGEPLSEKKLRRLEKNRLSARECRRRKKEATEIMERQINLLEGENLRLRLQLQVRWRRSSCWSIWDIVRLCLSCSIKNSYDGIFCPMILFNSFLSD